MVAFVVAFGLALPATSPGVASRLTITNRLACGIIGTMSVSYENSKIIIQGIKAAGITSLSALPETWLGLLLQHDKEA